MFDKELLDGYLLFLRLELGLVVLATLLSSCMMPLPRTANPSAARPTDTLVEAHGNFLLGRPFRDFYDTAFVVTNAGTSAPRVAGIADLAEKLVGYDVVFYGESHGHSAVHLQQVKLLRALYDRDPHLVLSLEQFERDVQGVVDDYLAGRIGETALMDKGRAWDNYASSYRPLLIFAEEHHLPVIAAEAPEWAILCVGQWGTEVLDQFTPLERSEVAKDLHPSAGAYRDKFMKFQSGSVTHGGGGAPTPEAALRAERTFEAQVARDDTMAESIERALRQNPGFKVLHLTGSFHSAEFLGTVERLRQRSPKLKIAVIDPVEVADPNAPGFEVGQLAGGTVLQLIYPRPDSFVEQEDMSTWIAKMNSKRKANNCKYVLPAAKP